MASFPYYQGVKAVAHTWLDYVCDDYAASLDKWVYARDHYTGECASPWRIPSYLVRKKIGETVEAFEERVLLADYTTYFGSVVDTLAGMMASVEPDDNRDFGLLGDKEDKASIAGRLWMDADGSGNSWSTLWHLAGTDLVGVHDAWVLVEGGTDGRVDSHVRLIPVESVPNYRYQDGVLVEALLKERVDTRTSIEDDPDQKYEEQWVKYTTAGWSRWHKKRDVENKTEEPEQLAAGTYSYVTRSGKPTLPIFPIRLPLRRKVGYLMARKANAIFNKESERDHLLRFGAFPILNVFANDVTFKKIVDLLRGGSRVLQVMPGGTAHSYAAPDTAPATVLTETISQKEKAYYATAFREFGMSAQSPGRGGRDRVTATEVRHDAATGVAAFLSLLKSAIDNAENQALWLLEQTAFPGQQGKWGKAEVARSSDFAPFDVNETIERLRDRYVGPQTAVPIGREALIRVVKEIAAWDDIEVNDAEVGKAVDALIKLQENGGTLPPPPPPGGPKSVTVKGGPGKPDKQVTVGEGT